MSSSPRARRGRSRTLEFHTVVALGVIAAVVVPIRTGAAIAGPGPAGCISETGSSGECRDGTALDGATGVVVSPDASSVYVASETSRAVAVFSRNAAGGGIEQLPGTQGCVSDSGTGGACTDGRALVAARAIAVSPDGRNLYHPSTTSAAIAVFARDPLTGELRQLPGTAGCVSESGTNGGCSVGFALQGARSAAVTADGANVYVASFFSDAVAVFARDPTTGSLRQLPGTSGCISETGSGGACVDGQGLDGARTVVSTDDGRFVYVTSELSSSVTVFSRSPTTGALTQLPGPSGCLSETGSGGACVDGAGLGGAGALALDPQQEHAYVASMTSDAVAVFDRDPTTGVLTQLGGRAGCISETGSGGACTDGVALDRARSVVVAPEGTHLYVASETSDAIAVLTRDPVTGALGQPGAPAGCVSESGHGGTCVDAVALDAVRSVTLSPDGTSLYAAAFLSDAVTAFARDAATGRLTQLGSRPGGGAAPSVTRVTISPTAPRTNDVLLAAPTATDPEGDPVTFAYAWRRNGSPVAGATGPTLDLAPAGHGDAGDAITVAVTASDGVSTSAPVTSGPVTVVDSPPAFGTDLADRQDGEGERVALVASATDPDGELIRYSADGLPPGVTIDPATGTIAGTIESGAAVGSPYAATVRAVAGAATITDAFAWRVAAPTSGAIGFHAAAGAAFASRAAVPIARPAGVAPGDVIVAAILVVGSASVTPPPGWTSVRSDADGTRLRQIVFVRIATASERSTYRWSLSQTSKVAGVLSAYGGVDRTDPIVGEAGQANAASTQIVAPSLASASAGDAVVGFFGLAPDVLARITPPPGMQERVEVAASSGHPRPALALADAILLTSGSTGQRIATSSVTSPNVGQVVVLRAA